MYSQVSWKYFYEYRFVGGEDLTLVYLDGKIDIPGFLFRLIGRRMVGMFKKACDGDLEALKRYVEKSDETSAQTV